MSPAPSSSSLRKPSSSKHGTIEVKRAHRPPSVGSFVCNLPLPFYPPPSSHTQPYDHAPGLRPVSATNETNVATMENDITIFELHGAIIGRNGAVIGGIAAIVGGIAAVVERNGAVIERNAAIVERNAANFWSNTSNTGVNVAIIVSRPKLPSGRKQLSMRRIQQPPGGMLPSFT